VQESVTALLELEAKASLRVNKDGFERPNLADAAQIVIDPASVSDRPLQRMRRKQLLHQLDATLSVLTPVLKDEQWQLSVNLQSLPLANLLKRSLRRVEPLYNQRQVVLQVHNSSNHNVCGDWLKLECILFELLVTSCFYAQPGSRINFWCCPLPPESKPTLGTPQLELLIAESGLLDDCLNAVKSSPAKSPPTLNLKICQHVLHAWGGDLQFYQLEGDRYSSRLLLPLAK
jgi:hypothetical protein